MATAIDRSACPGRAPHGSASAWQKRGCRCPDAQKLNQVARSRWRYGYGQPALVDATGTRRRLQALGAIGWSGAVIGARVGKTGSVISAWRKAPGGKVHRRTAETVAVLYEQLSGTPGDSSSARERARALRWAPPLAWHGRKIDDPDATPDLGNADGDTIDEVAVARVCAGHANLLSLPRAERLAAVARMTERGMSLKAIASQTRTTHRTISRLRAQLAA